MNNLEVLLKKLEQVGKIEQFEIYKEIFIKCFCERDIIIYKYFDKFLILLDEYLNFDAKPDIRIRTMLSENFEIVFLFIRNSNNFDAFNKYSDILKKNEKLLPDALPKAKIFQYFGYFFWLRQDFDTSIKYFEQSLEIANNHCQPSDIPRRFTNLGYIYENSGNMERAEYYYNEGLEFAKRNNTEDGIKLAYDAMGRLYLSRDFFKRAIQYFEESLKIYNDDDEWDRVSVINNLASAHMYNKEFIKAKNYFDQIQEEWIKNGNPELFYSIRTNSAINYRMLNKFKKAERYILESIDFAKSNNLIEVLMVCYLELGLTYYSSENIEKASTYYKKSMKIAEETKNENQLQRIYTSIGELYIAKNQYVQSLEYLKKAIKLCKKQDNHNNFLKLLTMISTCYEEMKDFEKANSTQKEYNKINEEFLKEQQKKEKELAENPLIGKGKHKQYIFRESNSLISNELKKKIGIAFVGKNPVMKKIVNQVILAAGNSNPSILIRGESGTGKEIIAKMIHYIGDRKSNPFVAVNSASFTPGIVQSALFGHLKGSFTGASSRQIGHFEAADKGTIFFDEIGDMPLDIQSTLLRVLEEKTIQPVGSHKSIKVDFRLISATNIDIYEQVKLKKFRLDFLNRINTLEIIIPPLRERRDDIPILVNHFINDICDRLDIKRPSISASALKMLCDYDYPGNVRELNNTIEKLILFCKNNEINIEDIYMLQNDNPKEVFRNQKFSTLNLEKVEKAVIKQALLEANNVKAAAARLLGITSSSMLRKLKKLNI